MVGTVLVTEEEAAVVAETARVADASSASGRGSQCAGGAPMAQTANGGLLRASDQGVGGGRGILVPGQAFTYIHTCFTPLRVRHHTVHST